MRYAVNALEGALLDAAVAKALNQPFHFIALGEYPFDLPQHHRRVFFRVDGDHVCVGQMGLGPCTAIVEPLPVERPRARKAPVTKGPRGRWGQAK